MPPPPPIKDVLDAISLCVLPGAGAAAVVTCAFLVVGRWRAAALGSAVAVVFAFMGGNFTLANLNTEQPAPTWENTSRLLPWQPGAEAPGYQWLARAALVLVVTGLLTRWLGLALARVLPERVWWLANVAVWWPRLWAIGIVSGWLVLGNAAADPQWAGLRWQLAGAAALVWLVLDGVSRGGASGELSAQLAAVFFAGSAVLLYSHNAKFMELAVVLGSAMFGIAVAVLTRQHLDDAPKALASGAVPAAALFLPGLLLGTRPSHAENKVPDLSFWLIALAPLVLAPFLIPRVSRQNRWVLIVLRTLLILTPLVIAVVLAGQHEKFPYEEEPEW
ncbi:hypothetical protein R5W23_006429 [Gemmata sp. JC673]|uniref:Uncharacterized protein n=1 Tax=Gemmata algarum TaxID=2975278 RepID=A0ABU5EZT9_9BACT|nr:hypothetical protein [Gemmata algarum]MDY3559211.1 hypothetical protein [Gemmata algarum]